MKTIFVLLAVILLIWATPIFAATPVDPSNPDLMMYANAYDDGDFAPVNIGTYFPGYHPARLNPANALGPFDAIQSDPTSAYNSNEDFFSLASRVSTTYTFAGTFANVDGVPDIQFSEVTWGASSAWHPEAAKVYLTGAYVKGAGGIAVPYIGNDDGYGYYAGIIWNKTGLIGITDARRLQITESYFSGTRDFEGNTFYQDGNFAIGEFNLPEEVVCATGITLVDVTKDVYVEFQPLSYYQPAGGTYITGINSTWDGTCVIVNSYLTFGTGIGGSTDGYDLDAIRVWKCPPVITNSACGMGDIIKKGNWFMYNTYHDTDLATPGNNVTYNIQLGNPKGGINTIGTFWVEDLGSNQYEVNYEINDEISVTIGDWIYNYVVVAEHLGISDTMNFTASPGTDDNQDFGMPFTDSNGNFYIFAHFTVGYE